MEEQALLEDLSFVTLYGGVIMLNVVVALYLLLRRGNAIAPEVTSPVRLRRWSAAFMLYAALSHVLWLFYAVDPSRFLYLMICGLDVLLLIPTIAGIMLSMLQDRRRPVWPVLVALIPAIAFLALVIIRNNEAFLEPIAIYVTFLYTLMIVFAFFAVRHYGRWLRDNYADLENKEIWQSTLILAVFLLFFVNYGKATVDSPFMLYLMQIVNIILVGLLLWRSESLPLLTESPSPTAESEEVHISSAKASVSSKIGQLLKKHCENKQLYLQNDLTLAQLAQTIGTNRYYLSQHFAQQGITYNAYINGLRVSHFMGLYREAVASPRVFTAQELAFESGFHSYSTFSAAFKQHTGKTVTAWMRDSAE